MSERARWLELLPFYLNGTLDPVDRAWVQEYLERNPDVRPQLEFQEALRGTLITGVERSVEAVPATIGLPSTLSRIRARSPRSRLLEWVFSTRTDSGWRIAPVLVAALLVIGVQSLMLMQPQREPVASVRSIGRSLADGPLLRVNFKPEARESDMRLLLIETRALIVAGPTRLGDYYVKTVPERLSETRSLIGRSPLVQQVDEVPGLPEEVLE
jgi:hypothetical protein